MLREEEIARRVAVRILKEDDGGYGGYEGGYGFDVGVMGGPNFIGGEHLKQIVGAFTAPFQELFGGAKKAITHMKALMHVAFETVATTIIPFLESDYDKVFKSRDEQLKVIEQQYEAVHKATWDALKRTDWVFGAFCMAPAAFLTTAAFTRSPRAIVQFIDFAGGDKVKQLVGGFGDWWKSQKSSFAQRVTYRNRYNWFGDARVYSAGMLVEDDEREQKKFKEITSKKIKELLSNPDVQTALRSSPELKKMQSDAQKVMISALDSAYSHAKSALERATSVEKLDSLSKGKLKKEIERVKEESKKKGEEVDDGQISDSLTTASRAAIKKFYIDKATSDLEKARQSIPDGHPYLSALKSQVDRLNKL